VERLIRLTSTRGTRVHEAGAARLLACGVWHEVERRDGRTGVVVDFLAQRVGAEIVEQWLKATVERVNEAGAARLQACGVWHEVERRDGGTGGVADFRP
jgi:hypothetical protein